MNMNNENGNGVSFFKTSFKESVDYLALPPRFARKHLQNGNNNNKTQSVVLKIKSVGKWRVKYLKIEDKYYFMDGWLNFMKENHVQNDDVLVFWLLSSSPLLIFGVFIYASNGCLKHPLKFSGGEKGISQKKRFVNEEISDDKKSLKRVVKEYFIHRIPMNKTFVRAAGADHLRSAKLMNDEGKFWNVTVQKYGGPETPYITTGWFNFRKDNKLKIGDVCEFSHVKANLFHVRIIKKGIDA
ncbi:hypothetical protein OSB04_000381 [Centaurea solstitialis]|uniref:TF-B3 domain-containing protein n=1 Tax=Centaurea solstitialis TaxID=347529 RepID=A0AA38U0P4_9ASTR|nr:hypothetical protein OSB04_000381 [Centaurea solstitialis]